jgi:hypothetical protein
MMVKKGERYERISDSKRFTVSEVRDIHYSGKIETQATIALDKNPRSTLTVSDFYLGRDFRKRC